jgi:hypothetical protein
MVINKEGDEIWKVKEMSLIVAFRRNCQSFEVKFRKES